MIQDKIDALGQALETTTPMSILVFPTRESPGYVEDNVHWTYEELQWLLRRAHLAT
jgi:hypothetical protein